MTEYGLDQAQEGMSLLINRLQGGQAGRFLCGEHEENAENWPGAIAEGVKQLCPVLPIAGIEAPMVAAALFKAMASFKPATGLGSGQELGQAMDRCWLCQYQPTARGLSRAV